MIMFSIKRALQSQKKKNFLEMAVLLHNIPNALKFKYFEGHRHSFNCEATTMNALKKFNTIISVGNKY